MSLTSLDTRNVARYFVIEKGIEPCRMLMSYLLYARAWMRYVAYLIKLFVCIPLSSTSGPAPMKLRKKQHVLNVFQRSKLLKSFRLTRYVHLLMIFCVG